MTRSSAQYGSGIISSRSRRLRTIAAVLLAAIIAMALYGTHVLVPRINRAAGVATAQAAATKAAPPTPDIEHKRISRLNLTRKEARVLRFDVIFEAAYWTIWTLLVLSLLLVAWMDLREVSRTYLNQRRELWSIATNTASEEVGQLSPDGHLPVRKLNGGSDSSDR